MSKRQGKQSSDAANQTISNILETATRLFCEHGFDGCSIRDIANQASVSHGVIRHHFGSKQDIWNAIAQSALTSYKAILLPQVLTASQSDSPLEAFKNLVCSFIRLTEQRPELVRLIAREGASENERSLLFKEEFTAIHKHISVLFERAKTLCPPLARHTSDSFFLFLLSLTIVPIVLPSIAGFLDIAKQTDSNSKLREELIIATLFSEQG